MKERTVTVSAFTKAYAMDGWRMGYAAAPKALIEDLPQDHHEFHDTPLRVRAGGSGRSGDSITGLRRKNGGGGRATPGSRRGQPQRDTWCFCARPQGTIYAFPDISGLGIKANELARRILSEVHVAVESGSFYSSTRGENHLRICFGSEPYERVAEAMERLQAILGKGVGN